MLNRRLSVAILDSGVTPDHPHVNSVSGGVAFTPDGTSENYLDRLGHGTAVAAVIHEKAPDANLLIVKIFDRQLSTSIQQLVGGLAWALDQRADFINLSLGTRNEHHCAVLQPLIERSVEIGCRIVSAAQIDGKPCFPGSMNGVLGVELNLELDRNQVSFVTANLATASPLPRPIPGVPIENNLRGISFAVANATGFLCAQAISERSRAPEPHTPSRHRS